jgi:hypothetical protein
MSEFYWPSGDKPGEYIVEASSGDTEEWRWDGAHWFYLMPGFPVFRTTQQLIEWGYLGVRREPVTLTPTPKTITPDPDDGNAMVAQEALDEWRACKQQPRAADWAYRWAVDLCERLGAR